MGIWSIDWPRNVGANKLHRPTEKRGQRVLTEEARAYRDLVALKVREYPAQPLPEGDLAIFVISYPPTAGEHDDDNHMKLVRDGVALGYQFNDKRIKLSLTLRRREVRGGRLELILVALDSVVVEVPGRYKIYPGVMEV